MHNHSPKRLNRSPNNSGGDGPGGNTRVGGATPEDETPQVLLTKNLTVKELAEKLAIKDTDVIKGLFLMGHMRTVHQLVELEYAKDLATKLGFEVCDSDREEDQP